MISHIGFDLDGTLLNSKKEIDDLSRIKISELKKGGISFILISSRHIYEMVKYAKELEFSEKDYIISCDGVYAYSVKNGKPVLMENGNFLTYYDAFEIQKMTGITEMICICDKNDIRVKFGEISLKKRVRLLFKTPDLSSKKISLNYLSLKNIDNLEIEKIVIFLDKTTKELEEKYHVIRLDNNRFEILNKRCGKYNALCRLENGGIIKKDNLLYFGDDFNDLVCFKNLKHTVAMGSAPEEIKKLADSVTDDCDSYGIYNALRNIKFI